MFFAFKVDPECVSQTIVFVGYVVHLKDCKNKAIIMPCSCDMSSADGFYLAGQVCPVYYRACQVLKYRKNRENFFITSVVIYSTGNGQKNGQALMFGITSQDTSVAMWRHLWGGDING